MVIFSCSDFPSMICYVVMIITPHFRKVERVEHPFQYKTKYNFPAIHTFLTSADEVFVFVDFEYRRL